MTATDASRFAIRVAREVTGRNLVLVFDRCYHGNLDETLVSLKDGKVYHWMDRDREERVVGLLPNPASTTRVIQFNDLDALEKALSPQDIACVLCEPGSFQAEETSMGKSGNAYLCYYLIEAASSVRMHNAEYGSYYRMGRSIEVSQ